MHAPKSFYKILNVIDHYNTDRSFSQRLWEALEDAFNSIMMGYFTPRKGIDSEAIVYTLDDNKVHFNYPNLRKISYGCESGLKQV